MQYRFTVSCCECVDGMKNTMINEKKCISMINEKLS